jgi:3-methyladenine DNA glycosylase AlkC
MAIERKGARRPTEVPDEVLRALERGEESANHMEQIALDMSVLMRTQFPTCGDDARSLEGEGLVSRMRIGGEILFRHYGLEVAEEGRSWQSDTCRGWAAMAIGAAPDMELIDRLRMVRMYADDDHFAVREWAWLSLRPHVIADLDEALSLLPPWTGSDSFKVRRFASEVTRPRGVWSRHIEALKADPARGLPILAPLRADKSRYVQDSVANWLNDAAKSRPEWVEEICCRWQEESSSAPVLRICAKGCRSINAPAIRLGPGSSIAVPPRASSR